METVFLYAEMPRDKIDLRLAGHRLVIHVLNRTDQSRPVTIDLAALNTDYENAEWVWLSAESGTVMNTLEAPDTIKREEDTLRLESSDHLEVTAPAYSFTEYLLE